MFDALYATGGRPLLANGGQVLRAEFSPNRRTLATIMNDNSIHLWDLTVADLGAQSTALPGHADQVSSVSYSPDGTQIVTAGADGTVRIWDARSGQELRRLTDHTGPVTSAAFSPDGTQIVTAGCGKIEEGSCTAGSARIWDAITGTELVRLVGHEDSILQATWSRYESTMLTTSIDGTVRTWDAVTGEEVSKLLLDLNGATPVLSPDQRWLAAGLGDGTVLLWQLVPESAGTRPIALTGHEGAILALAFSPDGKWLASGSSDESVQLWDLTSPESKPLVMREHHGAVVDLVFSTDGHWLGSASKDATANLRNIEDPTVPPIVLRGHDGALSNIALSPEGKLALTIGADGTARLWNTARYRAQPTVLLGHEEPVYSLAVMNDGQKVASASWDGTIRVSDLGQPTWAPTLIAQDVDSPRALAVSRDGKSLASGGEDAIIRIWDPTRPGTKSVISWEAGSAVRSLEFSAAGDLLISAQADGNVHLWNPVTGLSAGAAIASGEPGPQQLNDLALSPDGKWLAAGGTDAATYLWRLDALKQPPERLAGSGSSVFSMAFSPDSQLLASAGWDGMIQLWKTSNLQTEPEVLLGHQAAVRALAFSPDDSQRRWLASASEDGTVRLWDIAQLEDGAIVLSGSGGTVRAVEFGPMGDWLVAAGDDGSLRQWELSPEALLTSACDVASRNLTPTEWTQFFPAAVHRATCQHLTLESGTASRVSEGVVTTKTQRAPTVELSAENVARLRRYPRPPLDNGRGLHFALDLSPSSIQLTTERLKSIDAKWTLIYAQDEVQGARAAKASWKAGIMPVVRIGRQIDESFDPAAYVKELRNEGLPAYIQIFNEPSDQREWSSSDLGADFLQVFAEKWAKQAARVYDVGGYPGVQVLEQSEFDAVVDAVNKLGRTDIWDKAFLVLHNYGTNHPPAWPYNERNQRDNPGQTILEDTYGVLSFLAGASWMTDRLGFVLPIIGGEGGWEYGMDQDKRYPKVEAPLHAQYHKEMFEWFRTGVLSNGEPLPDYLFSVTPWIASGWGADDWWGGVLGTKTQTIEAVQSIPPFVRRFSWD